MVFFNIINVKLIPYQIHPRRREALSGRVPRQRVAGATEADTRTAVAADDSPSVDVDPQSDLLLLLRAKFRCRSGGEIRSESRV